MSRRKNISGGPLDVPILGRMVDDGETVDVPDFQPGSTDSEPLPVVWPENRWKLMPDLKPKDAAKDTADTAGTADTTDTGKAAG